MKNNITIVIPAMNEAESIPAVLSEAVKISDDILVVDGHSTDSTVEIARKFNARVIQQKGRGKGMAIQSAVDFIERPITVFIDADGSHDPNMIPELIKPIIEEKADHVTGSRLLGGSSELHGGFDEFLRLTGSSFITACINWRFKVRLSDSQNGFRAIKTDVLRQLNLTEKITTIEQEMIMKTLAGGWQMAEVPTHEYCRTHGTSHIKVSRVSFRYVYSLIKYLFFSSPNRNSDKA